MAVRVQKSAVNIREKLAELERPIGVNGAALMATNTPQEAFSLIGAGSRNRIINGDMRIDQRNAGASVSISGTANYAADRFNLYVNTGTCALQRVADAPTGFLYSDKVTVSSAGSSSSGASNAVHFEQKIEGHNIIDLSPGTSGARTITLSFWVKSSITGIYSLHFGNDADRFYVTTYTINSANTWEYKTKTITLSTSGTWNTTTGRGLEIVWSLLGGSGYQTSSTDQWISAEDYHATGSVQFAENASATWQITGVQLEQGKIATPFEYRSYGQELALCQRYYFDLRPLSGTSVYPTTVQSSGTDGWYALIKLPVSMRTTPTLNAPGTYTGTSNFRLNWTFPGSTTISSLIGIYYASPDTITIYGNKTSSFAGTGYMVGLEVHAALTSTIGASAEI